MAASHLDAVTFQICSQSFKIMPTALFAVWLLGQYLTPLQWGSLPVLAVGVVFVTMNGSTPADGDTMKGESDLILGLAASALSGLSSAYAGEGHMHSHRHCSLTFCLPESNGRAGGATVPAEIHAPILVMSVFPLQALWREMGRL